MKFTLKYAKAATVSLLFAVSCNVWAKDCREGGADYYLSKCRAEYNAHQAVVEQEINAYERKLYGVVAMLRTARIPANLKASDQTKILAMTPQYKQITAVGNVTAETRLYGVDTDQILYSLVVMDGRIVSWTIY